MVRRSIRNSSGRNPLRSSSCTPRLISRTNFRKEKRSVQRLRRVNRRKCEAACTYIPSPEPLRGALLSFFFSHFFLYPRPFLLRAIIAMSSATSAILVTRASMQRKERAPVFGKQSLNFPIPVFLEAEEIGASKTTVPARECAISKIGFVNVLFPA